MTLQIISITAKLRDDLLLTLKHDSEKAVLCFTENQMIANPHSLVLQISEKRRHYEPIKFEIEDGQIEATNTTKYR